MAKTKRRELSAAFKAKVALEAIKGHKTINEIASEFEIHPNQVSTWKRRLLESATDAFTRKNERREDDFEKERGPWADGFGKKGKGHLLLPGYPFF